MIDAIDNNVGYAPALGRAVNPTKPRPADFNGELERRRVEREARGAAEQLVASAFVLPLLEQMRDDPLRVGLFDGGSAEDLWGQQLNTLLADRIVKGAKLPLVDSIYQNIVKKGQAARAVTPGLDTHG